MKFILNGGDLLKNWFISMVSDEKYLYWITEINGHFMKMNLQDNSISYMTLPNVPMTMKATAALSINQSFIFYTSNNGEEIIRYDRENGSTKVFNIACQDKNLNMSTFSGVINNDLVIVPTYGNSILYMNIYNGKVQLYPLINASNEMKQCFSLNAYRNNDNIKIFSWIDDEWIDFSLEKRKVVNRKKMPKEIGKVVYFERYDEKFLLINECNELIMMDGEKYSKLTQFDTEPGKCGIFHVANDKVWAMPFWGDKIYLYLLKEGRVQEFVNYPKDYGYFAIEDMAKITNECTANGKTYFAMHSGTHIFCVDDKSGQGYFIDAKWPEAEQIINEMSYRNFPLTEEMIDVTEYLNYLCKTKSVKNNNIKR